MTIKGGSRPACAACRFRRRRCSSDCPLAPFFPANEPKLFQNVYSLYGFGHVLKILSHLKDDEQKEEAMKSIQYESDIRQIHRVHGCYGLIVHLQQKIVESIKELRDLRFALDAYRKMNVNSAHVSDQLDVVGGSGDWVSSMVNGGNDLGFYNNPPAGYDYRNDQTRTAIDEFQQFCRVGEEEITPSYDQQSILGFYNNPTGDHGYDHWDDQTRTTIDEFQQFCRVGEEEITPGYDQQLKNLMIPKK